MDTNNKKKLAVFLNKSNLINRKPTVDYLQQVRDLADIFDNETHPGVVSADNLFTGISASYEDYEYILLLNFAKPNDAEHNSLYLFRQEYAMQNFLQSPHHLEKLIETLSNSPYEGLMVVPPDYAIACSWETLENWLDYYDSISQWAKENNFHVDVAKGKPPLAMGYGCALIKTTALQGFNSLKFDEKELDSEFLSYAVPVFAQKNGFLPSYIMLSESVAHNMLGYINASNWMPDDMEEKKEEYYRFNKKQNAIIYKALEELKKADDDLRKEYMKTLDREVELRDEYMRTLDNATALREEYMKTLNNEIALREEYMKTLHREVALREEYEKTVEQEKVYIAQVAQLQSSLQNSIAQLKVADVFEKPMPYRYRLKLAFKSLLPIRFYKSLVQLVKRT